MKLLWFSHFVPFPPRGGAYQRSFCLLREMATQHEVALVAFNIERKPREQLEEYRSELEKHCRTVEFWDMPLEWKGTRWWAEMTVSPLFRQPFACRSFWSEATDQRWRHLLDAERPDLVHLDSPDLALFVPSASSYRKLLNHHNCESAMAARRAENEPHPLKRMYLWPQAYKLARVEAEMCHQVDANAVVSEQDAALLSERNPRAHIHIVENGTDTTYFQPRQREPEAENLIFAGSLNWYPNLSAVQFFMREVWPLITRVCPDARFTIAGQKPPKWLKSEVLRDPRIELVPNPADVRPWLQKADVFVCPITDGGGTRLKILDAMAMGLPVVSTGVGCEGLRVSDRQCMLIANGAEEFARRVLQLLDDKGLRRKLAAAGRALVEEHYSWHPIGKQLQRAYNCALGGGCDPQPVKSTHSVE